jgi:histidine ammonia-lyase
MRRFDALQLVLPGVGQPLTPERTKRLLALRINILAKGYSGITPKVLEQYVDAFNGKAVNWR